MNETPIINMMQQGQSERREKWKQSSRSTAERTSHCITSIGKKRRRKRVKTSRYELENVGSECRYNERQTCQGYVLPSPSLLDKKKIIKNNENIIHTPKWECSYRSDYDDSVKQETMRLDVVECRYIGVNCRRHDSILNKPKQQCLVARSCPVEPDWNSVALNFR